MRTDLRCNSCQTKLSVKIELQGKHVRCPKCRNPVKVTLAPVVLPKLGNKRTDDEPMLAEVLPDHLADFEVLPDEDPNPPPAPRPARKSTPAQIKSENEELPKPKKKKKKNKSKADESTRIPVWMWIAGGLGAVIASGGIVFGIMLALRTQTPDSQPIDWKGFAIEVAILIPINIVILIAGMFISSALGGGINFGDAKTAIIGSFFLVVVVVLVSLIPIVGRYLTLIVWLVGFMTIFGLDPWEARFLFFICWILSYAANMGYAHIQNRIMEKRWERMMDDDDDDKPVKKKSRDSNKPGKKDPDDDDPDDRGYLQPGEWHDRLGGWIEAQQRVLMT